MKNTIIMWMFLIVVLLVGVPIGISSCNASRSQLVVSEARADAIRWEAQARATALTIAASTPVIVFGGVFIITLSVIALAMVIVFKTKQNTISREIVYLPPPGQRRSQTWQALEQSNILDANSKDIIELPPWEMSIKKLED